MRKTLNIIGARKWFYVFSSLAIALSVASLVVWGLKPGIDFTGGALWEFRFASGQDPSSSSGQAKAAIEQVVKENVTGDVFVSLASDGVFSVRMKELSEKEHQDLAGKIEEVDASFEELRWEAVGPTVGATLRQKSLWAIVLVVLGISLYVAFAFRKASRPVSSFKYGLVTVFTLFHDVIIPLGVFSALSHFRGVELDTNFVVAMLVIMGFSVHDTIVVFDRIREKLRTAPLKDFEELVNLSLNETLVRSINTSLTVALVLAAMLVWGGAVLQYFILAMMIGVIVGTYSSIAIGSMLLVDVWHLQNRN